MSLSGVKLRFKLRAHNSKVQDLAFEFIKMKLISLILCIFGFQLSVADEGYYLHSNAAFDADSNVNLMFPPRIFNEITTASVADAEAPDNSVYITYVGTFSNSGPHFLSNGASNVFVKGTTTNTIIPLTRKIGDLTLIILETASTDAWLMDSINVDIYKTRCEIAGPNTWLEAVNSATGTYNSARAQISLPSLRYMELPVATSYAITSASG